MLFLFQITSHLLIIFKKAHKKIDKKNRLALDGYKAMNDEKFIKATIKKNYESY